VTHERVAIKLVSNCFILFIKFDYRWKNPAKTSQNSKEKSLS